MDTTKANKPHMRIKFPVMMYFHDFTHEPIVEI